MLYVVAAVVPFAWTLAHGEAPTTLALVGKAAWQSVRWTAFVLGASAVYYLLFGPTL